MNKRGLAVTAAILVLCASIRAAGAQGMAPGMAPGVPSGMAPAGMMPQQGMAPPASNPQQVCMQFQTLNAETQKRANAVQTAMKAKADRKEICKLMTVFVASEGQVLKFLVANKTWCGVPDEVITRAKASHEGSTKFRDAACTEQPQPKAPSLSDAIKTTPVDSSKNTNTKTGGTFDTLTGNPLGR